MVLDLRVGGTYSPFTQVHPSDHMPLSVLGMTGATATFPFPNFPGVTATGPFGSYTSLNSGAGNYWYGSLVDGHAELSKSLQKHSIKTGVEYLLARDDYQDPESSFPPPPSTLPRSSPTTTPPTAPRRNTVAMASRSLLLGYPGSGSSSTSSGAAVIQPGAEN